MVDNTAKRGAAADPVTCQPAFDMLGCASTGINAGEKISKGLEIFHVC